MRNCINPVLNKLKKFIIKDDTNEWKEESQGDFVHQMNCIDEWQNEEDKMSRTQIFERVNDKVWDTWREYVKRIRGTKTFMNVCTV